MMSNAFQLIKAIPIVHVLDKLGVKYSVLGSSLGLWDGGKLSDGRRVTIHGNYVNDFSGKGRAQGGPFAFVKAYLKLSSKETFNRFSKNYGITGTFTSNTKTKVKTEKKPKLRYHRNW